MRLIDADVLKNIIKEEASSLVLCDESACEIDLFELIDSIPTYVDWSKIPVNTPIFVRHSENNPWEKRHFAKFVNGKIYAYYKGQTSWSTENKPIRWNYAKLVDSDQFEEEEEEEGDRRDDCRFRYA